MKTLKSRDSTASHQWAIRVGTEIVASAVIALGIGYFLDKWLGTRPLFLLLFFLFGAAAGFLNLYRVLRIDQKQDQQKGRRE